MKITVLCDDGSPGRRGHRLALAASTFADAKLVGIANEAAWAGGSGPIEVVSVRSARLPEFFDSFVELVEAADGDVLIAVKPHLPTLGAALVAAERTGAAVIADLDDIEVAHAPRERWIDDPRRVDLSRPASAIYASLLTKALPGCASVITVASAMSDRFGGTVIRHPVETDLLDPGVVDREKARRTLGFDGPTVVFPGTPRRHKGIKALAGAVASVPGARLVVTTPQASAWDPDLDLSAVDQIRPLPYQDVPTLFAAADVVAIPQQDTESSRCQLPMKLLDAMSMGCAIVTTSVPDIPEVLGDCGWIVPPDDETALSRAITEILDDPAQARAAGERARDRCLQNYSIDRVGEALRRVVHEAAA
jgi:glycosyltransferase involved in cell wall biosynthesis